MYYNNNRSDIVVVDLETTGVNPERNSIIQLAAAICDVNFNVRSTIELKMRPFEGAIIDQRALDVNGFTAEEIKDWPEQYDSLAFFSEFLKEKCYSKPNFALWYCWGVGFDNVFLQESYKRVDLAFPCRYTWNCMRGICTHLSLLNSVASKKSEVITKNVKEFCRSMSLSFDGTEHDALADVLNSIKVMKKLGESVAKSRN